MEIITFTKSALPNGWLGNICGFWEKPLLLTWKGKQAKASENIFQGMRFDDEEIINKIYELKPYDSKTFAKHPSLKDKMVVEPQSEEDVRNMMIVLLIKIHQHEHLFDELMKFEYNQVIIEDVSNRRGGSGLFWGAARIGETNQWAGFNILGQLWMAVRAYIKFNSIYGTTEEYIEKAYPWIFDTVKRIYKDSVKKF